VAFGTAVAASAASSLSASAVNPFDREGLMIRSESRESLRGPSRSRRGSPTRRSPLMMPLKESIE
jgi:hypothetical protein